jgi:hypothetical protein
MRDVYITNKLRSLYNKISDGENNIMNAQNGEQQYSHESVQSQIDSAPIVGGPSISDIQPLQVTGCTAGSLTLYNQVQSSIDCTITSQGPTNVSSLGQAALLAETANQPPISCMLNLINGQYSNCGTTIPSNLRKAAFNAWTEVTGYKPFNLTNTLNTINQEQKTIVSFNAFYIFIPILILIIIVIWLAAGFGWFNWVVGIFLTVLAFIILYSASIAYRIHLQGWLNNNNQQLQQDATNSQNNFENSIAYWPQGLFAVSCAVTSTGGTGNWTCNETNPCPPCAGNIKSNNMCGNETNLDAEDEEDVPPEPPKLIRKRRIQRRRKN